MTSSNIHKIVQNNLNLNPWVLSKSTNEIVNTCIQKIYKQMPQNFQNDLKKPKIASLRPENKAPIRTYKAQHCEQQQPIKIRPQLPVYPAKKSSRSKINRNQLMDILKTSSKHNNQISRKMTSTAITAQPRKKLLKSPNLKIYGSRRYGSSASSSRSSLFRRFDEKRRQRQQYPSQLNYMVRSMHTGQIDATFAKYLMPIRNQQLKGDLGSVPDAMRVSSTIQNDLMYIDAAMRNRISVNDHNTRRKTKNLQRPEDGDDGLKMWKHPPPLSKFQNKVMSQLLGNPRNDCRSSSKKPAKLSREHRDYGRYNVGPLMPVRHSSPPNELFTAEHERDKTELNEKHRRNRMKKLGLVQDSPNNSTTECSQKPTKPMEGETYLHLNSSSGLESTDKPQLDKQNREQDSDQYCYTKSSPLTTQLEARRKFTDPTRTRTKRALSHFPVVKNIYESLNVESTESPESPFNITTTKQSKGRSVVSPKASELKGGGETSLSSTSTLTSTLESSSSNNAARLNGPLALAASQFNSSGIATSQVYSGYRYNRSSYFPTSKY